jgi:hypothetical protein
LKNDFSFSHLDSHASSGWFAIFTSEAALEYRAVRYLNSQLDAWKHRRARLPRLRLHWKAVRSDLDEKVPGTVELYENGPDRNGGEILLAMR